MTTKPEWERLAEALDAGDNFYAESSLWFDRKLAETAGDAAAELRRLGQENTKQSEQIKALTHLVTQLHSAKGRYHTQRALCALFDAFGLSNTKPERKTK